MITPTNPAAARDAVLHREAQYLYSALFGKMPAERLADQYVQAHRHHCAWDPEAIDLRLMVSRKLDAEALEIALRRRHPILTRKFQILLYLAEATPEGYSRLVNDTDRPARAWLALTAAGLRTTLKYLKGRFLLWRHSLV